MSICDFTIGRMTLGWVFCMRDVPRVKRIVSFLRVVGAVIAAMVAAVGRRLRRGPLVQGWSWAVELRREAIAALLTAGIESADPETWNIPSVEAPLPKRLRAVIEVEPAQVGGVAGEWLRVRGLPSDRPTLLYFHGGGHVVGSPGMERPFIGELVAAARADAFSVDYRLAPRHPFPAALDDAIAVFTALPEPERVVVVGDSAGGNLATALLVRLRDEGLAPPAAAVLFSPWLDLTGTAASITTNVRYDYLPDPAPAAAAYLGPTDPTHPYASPLFADPTGLPPLLVLAGGKEIILDDATRFAEKAERAGVDVTLHIEPAMFHVWPALIPNHPTSRRTILLVADWIARTTS